MPHFFLVHLRAVNGQPRSSVELLVADVALEVFCLLVVDEDLLVVKLPLTVPAEVAERTPASCRLSSYVTDSQPP